MPPIHSARKKALARESAAETRTADAPAEAAVGWLHFSDPKMLRRKGFHRSFALRGEYSDYTVMMVATDLHRTSL